MRNFLLLAFITNNYVMNARRYRVTQGIGDTLVGFYERKKESKTRKQELDQESDREKKKDFLFFLVKFSCFLIAFLFSCFLYHFLWRVLVFLFSYFLVPTSHFRSEQTEKFILKLANILLLNNICSEVWN